MLGDRRLHLVKGLALGDLRQLPRQLRRVLVASVLNDALKRRSISFQPGVRMVLPLAVNSFPAQVNVAVTASNTWGAATAHSSLQHTRDSSFFSPSVSPSKPFCTNSIVGMMAWWSLTFLLFSTRPNCGAMSRPAAKGSSGHRPDTMLSAAGCISSVRYCCRCGDRSAASFHKAAGRSQGSAWR